MSQKAFQDLGSVRYCYGCGSDNKMGLRIKSKGKGDEAVCTWKARPHHCGGSKKIVNGGVIAILIDCHSLNLAIAHAYKKTGRAIGSAPRIAYVTAKLEVSYLRPAPIDKPLRLHARITKVEGRKTWVSCTLSSQGRTCATGRALGINVQRDKEA